jgi:microcystin-dependent protein
MTVYKWSQTPGADATADSTINWSEGQAPSSVNDSARGMMAAVAKWRDDITGIIATGGSGTAYTATSNQVFASNGNGYTIQFTPGTTNTGAVSLSVDGQISKPLRFLTGVDLIAGMLISGSLYQATFRSASDEWLLHSFDARIYSIPVGASVDYWGTTAPNSAFVTPFGQAISRAGYATLFALVGTTYGVGDGSTTFNIPDLRGRVVAGKDNMGGTPLGLITTGGCGIDGTALGASGGGQTQTLSIANINSFTPTGSFSGAFSSGNAVIPMHNWVTGGGGSTDTTHVSAASNSGGDAGAFNAAVTGTVSGSITMNALGSGTVHSIVQPMIIANKILRII